MNTENERQDFLRENLNREKPRRGEDSTIILKLQELQRICWYVSELGPIRREENPFSWRSLCNDCWHQGRWCGHNLYNCTIFTSGFAVTTVMIGIGLVGLHEENLATVYNCSCWIALHIMNVKEK